MIKLTNHSQQMSSILITTRSHLKGLLHYFTKLEWPRPHNTTRNPQTHRLRRTSMWTTQSWWYVASFPNRNVWSLSELLWLSCAFDPFYISPWTTGGRCRRSGGWGKGNWTEINWPKRSSARSPEPAPERCGGCFDEDGKELLLSDDTIVTAPPRPQNIEFVT